MADESSVRAAKAAQEQKLAVAKRVSTQAKIVETVVGSMLRNTSWWWAKVRERSWW